jgi:hypothetical protein
MSEREMLERYIEFVQRQIVLAKDERTRLLRLLVLGLASAAAREDKAA